MGNPIGGLPSNHGNQVPLVDPFATTPTTGAAAGAETTPATTGAGANHEGGSGPGAETGTGATSAEWAGDRFEIGRIPETAPPPAVC